MTLQKDREETQRMAEELAEKFVFLDFFRKYPQLNSIANESLIRSYLNGDLINAETLEEARQYLGSRLAVKSNERVQSDQQQQQQRAAIQASLNRAELEEQILALIPNKESAQYEQSLFKYKTDQDLENRLAKLQDKARLRGMSVAELHQYVKDGRKQLAPAPKIEQITLTKAELLRLTGQQMRQLLYRADGTPKPGARDQVDAIIRGN